MRNAWLMRPCLRSVIHAGILKAWETRRFNGMHQLTGGCDFVRSLVSVFMFLRRPYYLARTWFKAYLLMYCHANDSQEAWKAYNALITKIWPSNVNILSMSSRAVTSIAYFGIHGYAEKYDCDENSIASNRMQNISTLSQNTTDSCIDCENAELKYTRCL